MAELRRLPLHARHAELAARFGEFAGWQMPIWYSGAIEEHLAVRHAAGVFDISHMGRFRLSGPDAAGLLAYLSTRDPGRLAIGASAYGFACNPAGGIVDDLLIYRLEDETYLLICNAANAEAIGGLVAEGPASGGVAVEDLQAGTVLLAVQGPAAVRAVASHLGDGVLAIERRRCGEVRLGPESFLLARTGYTGEDGFEVLVDADAGRELVDALLAGGCLPCGLAARDSLRLEAALPLHGADIDPTTTPWEAGLGWAVELEHEFRGRDALAASQETTQRRLSCLLAGAPGVIRSHSEVYDGESVAGSVTSGGHSPMLGKSIALAYLPRALAREGRELSVDLRGRRIPCRVVKRPFYARPQ